MLVKEVMTKKVVTIEHDQSVFDACNKYKQYKVGCLLVIKNNSCAGIVTERDIIERTICNHKDPENTTVEQIMTSNIKTIHPLEKIEKAIEIMKNNNIKKLPVVQNEDIIGIITVTDLSKVLPKFSNKSVNKLEELMWRD